MLTIQKTNLRLAAGNSENAISMSCCNQRTKEYMVSSKLKQAMSDKRKKNDSLQFKVFPRKGNRRAGADLPMAFTTEPMEKSVGGKLLTGSKPSFSSLAFSK